MGRHAKHEDEKAMIVTVSFNNRELKNLIRAWKKDDSVVISKKFESAMIRIYLEP